MARLSATLFMGDPVFMPGVLLSLARRVRDGDLDQREREFLAAALERMGHSKNPAKEAAKAFHLDGPQRRRRNADALNNAIDRARAVFDLVGTVDERTQKVIGVEEAIKCIAAQFFVEETAVRKPYYKYREALEEHSQLQRHG